MRVQNYIFPIALILGGCSGPSQSAPTEAELCRQTVLNYAAFRDDPTKSSEYADLFTEDGIFKLGPNPIKGRAALIARHKASNKDTIFNHVMDDIDIKTDLTGESRVVVYTQNRGGDDNITRVIIGDYTDSFKMIDGSCLIARRDVSVVYDTSSARIIPTN